MVEIRPLAPAEYARLCADMSLRSRTQHWANLIRQQAGELLYLIAWDEGQAVGQVALFWRPENDPVAAQMGCPWVVDLLVHPDHRSRGVGAALLRACEEATRVRGARQVGLGVAVNNTRARAFYARLGYREAGVGKQFMSGSWQDDSGVTHTWEDYVIYLLKPLTR